MQNNIVKAFRQRLTRAGFTDISIYSTYKNEEYVVYCTSPNGDKIKRCLTLERMDCLPRVVWFDDRPEGHEMCTP